MNTADFNASVRAAMTFYLDLDLLQDLNILVSHRPTDEFRQAALSNVPYADLFRIGVERRDYNIALTDQSFFQFSRTGDQELELRYAFYPNPYNAMSFQQFVTAFPDATEDDGGLEDYSQYLSEQSHQISAPPIRYDMSPRHYEELVHPTAHFHFGTHGTNRWPVSFVLSPLTFALHVAKMFYHDDWRKGVDATSGRNAFDEKLRAAKASCAALAVNHFSAAERAQLHVT